MIGEPIYNTCQIKWVWRPFWYDLFYQIKYIQHEYFAKKCISVTFLCNLKRFSNLNIVEVI